MKHIIKTVLVASAMAAATAAQADPTANFTLVRGEPSVTAFGREMGPLSGSGALAFSESLIGALEVAGIVTTAVDPATVDIMTTEAGTQITANAPILSLSGEFDIGTAEVTARQVATMGGASMVAPKKNFATTTGSLSLTGITVDLGAKAIFADLTGGNGVGSLQNVHVWTYANIEGPTVFTLNSDITVVDNKLTGLAITDNAFNLFAKSLGLTNGGIAAMSEITDYGVMNSQIILGPVPEPSTYLMMGLGLVGLGFVAKRARRA